MKAYVVAALTTRESGELAAYRAAVTDTLEAFGGRFLVRGGATTVLEEDWPHARLVLLEFPSRAAAEEWYASPAYQAILPLRLRNADGPVLIVDGVA